ncbi:MAG: 2-amino-4-hydroxy-6-hydroxymethyldihydropteridine diphosphokinase [Micrococcaceae bacterium]
MDVIKATGIKAYGYHGVLVSEQQQGQEFIVDVALKADTSKAGYSDDLSHTINYAQVVDLVVDRIEGEPVQLIEALAEEIAQGILAKFDAKSVKVTVHKPHAPIDHDFQDISVTIKRESKNYPDATGNIPSLALQQQAARKANNLKLFFNTDGVQNPHPHFTTVLSLGANLGDRKMTIMRALEDLDRNMSMRLQKVSPLVETPPVGGPEQPYYLNLVAEFITTLTPYELLDFIHEVENKYGRTREVRWGARTLDIDIITYGNKEIDTKDLVIPHPRAHERAFVLDPWYRMDADAIFPTGQAVSKLLETAHGRDEVVEYRGK